MKIVFSLVLFFSIITLVEADEVIVTQTTTPYEVVELSGISSKQTHLGELSKYPIMYGFTLTETDVLETQLRQINNVGEPVPFRLLLIKENAQGRGVEEVFRFNPTSDDWVKTRDQSLGLTFWESELVSYSLEPGVYRMEVSTPENIGKYALLLGNTEESVGYFTNLKQVRLTQDFFGYSAFRMLAAASVYYTLGIIFLLLLIYKTRKYSRLITKNA